jgi:ABC-type Fe3+-siderophore transport system permease subunit
MMHAKPNSSPLLISYRQKQRCLNLMLIALSAAVLLSMLLAVCLGIVKIAPASAYHILMHKLFHLTNASTLSQLPPTHIDIVWQLRFPRVLMAALVGAGLAVCGTVMQSSVQNPLADPYILGISAGASFGGSVGWFGHPYGSLSWRPGRLPIGDAAFWHWRPNVYC